MTIDERKARDRAIRKAIKSDYPLIKFFDIDDEARLIAVAWVEGFEKIGMMEIEQKHKLASDIMNYTRRKLASRDSELRELREVAVKMASALTDAVSGDKIANSDYKRLSKALAAYRKINKEIKP